MTGHTNSEAVVLSTYGIWGASYVAQQPMQRILQQRSFVKFPDERNLNASTETVASNMQLVLGLADLYAGHGVDLVNLISEGTRGLIHAMDSFELSGSFNFESYATRCIRQRIECTIMNQVEPE